MSIQVLSYNIWFANDNRIERLESLIATIAHLNPDVLCLQEVTPDVYNILKISLGNYPHYFPNNLNYSYGSVTFSKIKFDEKNEYEFKSSAMGRKLVITRIGDIVVANTHFESEFRKNNAEKLLQYDTAKYILDDEYSKGYDIIFCSDTNILSFEEKLFFNDEEWKDLWFEKGSFEDEHTYDYTTNNNLKNKNVGKYRSRLDRIIYKLNKCKPLKYTLVKGISGMIEPSDHHGVMGEFAL